MKHLQSYEGKDWVAGIQKMNLRTQKSSQKSLLFDQNIWQNYLAHIFLFRSFWRPFEPLNIFVMFPDTLWHTIYLTQSGTLFRIFMLLWMYIQWLHKTEKTVFICISVLGHCTIVFFGIILTAWDEISMAGSWISSKHLRTRREADRGTEFFPLLYANLSA